ncbi:MAG: hypothetical protein ACTHOB_17830 [Ginsengibacter sp.]
MYKTNIYKGNPWFCGNTLALAYPIVFGLIDNRFNTRSEIPIEVMLYFSLALFIAIGFQMYYFEIQADNLLIKNHYFPWIQNKFPLTTIEEVKMEKHGRRSNGLRITFNDFNSKYYKAGSLRKETWKRLLTDFSVLGIKINDL